MIVRFLPYTKYHAKRNVGSTRFRVESLIKHWPEADIYKFGENPDVMIFQKVYARDDYMFPVNFKNKKILDICDPDWLSGVNIKLTVDAMDAVVVPTQPMKDFIAQLTDKPIKIIKDRFEMDFPHPKRHTGKPISLVWFGYRQNSELLKPIMKTIYDGGYSLTVISNDDPVAWRWLPPGKSEKFKKDRYTFKGFKWETVYDIISQHDLCILPKGGRPQDVFKSENRTIQSILCGVPVASDAEEFDKLQDPDEHNKVIKTLRPKYLEEYDVINSVKEYQELIKEIGG